MNKLVKQFEGLFWFADLDKLSIIKDKNVIIHQVLAYGTLADFKKLVKLYGLKTVRQEFLKPQPGLYYPAILNFCQYLLGVKKVNKERYLKNVYGNLL